jgi:hypothetical protein
VDNVVLALGVRPDKSIFDDVAAAFDKAYLVGDAVKVGRIADATRNAFNLAIDIK